jgi:hypothetical protein
LFRSARNNAPGVPGLVNRDRGWPPRARLLIAAGFCLSSLCGLCSPRAARASPPQRAGFTLTFWCGPPLDAFDDRRAAEVVAAGFNVVGFPCEGGYDRDRNLRALDVAARHGLGMVVADHRFGVAALRGGGDWRPGARQAVKEYAGHPALRGYFVADEPVVSELDGLAALVAELRALDPSHPAYVNLLPDYIPPDELGAESYEAYVERFVEKVEPRILSYDYYPFGKEKDRSTFFSNLSAIRWVAHRHHLPFMLIVLAMPHGPYRDPTEAELAWQVFHALAFGARGVSYFTYWTPPMGEEWKSHDGLIDGGRRTLHYHQAARINAKVRAIAAELERYESLAVADSTGETGLGFPLGPIENVEGGQVTAGLFRDDGGTFAVLLVNRDYKYGLRASLELRPGTARPEVFDDAARRWSESDLPPLLAPGDAVLLRWRPSAAGDGAPQRLVR